MSGHFMDKLKRQWRHWKCGTGRGKRAFSEHTLAKLGEAITAGEQRHRGEVRLVVECALPSEAIWNNVSNRERALSLFAEYGVWDTEDNCGVLLYVNLAEQKIDIVTDRAIARTIDNAVWQRICQTMTQGFAKGEFCQSTLSAIEQINTLLADHFPARGERLNELPDRPVML